MQCTATYHCHSIVGSTLNRPSSLTSFELPSGSNLDRLRLENEANITRQSTVWSNSRHMWTERRVVFRPDCHKRDGDKQTGSSHVAAQLVSNQRIFYSHGYCTYLYFVWSPKVSIYIRRRRSSEEKRNPRSIQLHLARSYYTRISVL